MKIKFLCLLLILAGILVTSGCVDAEARHFTSEAPEDLYRTIFWPYAGLLDREGPGMQGINPHDSQSEEFHPGHEPMHTLRNATSLLDSNIEKAEIISTRLESGIERYKAEGEDVGRLEALLEEYNFLVEEAKHYRALADAPAGEENNSSITNSGSYDVDPYGADPYNGGPYNGNSYSGDPHNVSSEDLKREYLIMSQRSMIQANHVLKDIFGELQLIMPGTEELNRTSRLNSTGEGKAILMGSFTLNLHLEDGKMAIAELSRDSEIDIQGDYTFEEKTEMHDKVRLYRIDSADVKVSGSRKTVLLSSEKIIMTADGEGYAAFQGNGTYTVEEGGGVREEEWGKPLFEERMGPEGYGPEGKDDNTEYGPDRKDNTEYGPNRKDDNTKYGPEEIKEEYKVPDEKEDYQDTDPEERTTIIHGR